MKVWIKGAKLGNLIKLPEHGSLLDVPGHKRGLIKNVRARQRANSIV